ncbi:hypothetical protein [Nostoc sp. CENA543]|uniref:hypothetical protein n=1 Tax=Nostoc sp. CENA543 TaxID=1869241 RepID=UPI001300009A|nr:hypothetical protein [Nostoc sp. CENA543]
MIANWLVLGMYQPDAIASYQVNGKPLLVVSNEVSELPYLRLKIILNLYLNLG